MKHFLLLLPVLVALHGCGGGGEVTPTSATTPITSVPETVLTIEGVNMPAGFQVIGDHGGIQIDENFYNLTLTNKGTVTVPGDGTNYANQTVTVSVTGETPVIAWRPYEMYLRVQQIVQSGNQFTYTLQIWSKGGTLPWNLFDKMPNTTAQAGLTVYNASGRVTFNSDYLPMKIAAIVKTRDGNVDLNTQLPIDMEFYPLPDTSRTYALVLSSSKVTVSSYDGATYKQALWIDATQYGSDHLGIRVGNYPGATNNPNGGTILLVDVTGL